MPIPAVWPQLPDSRASAYPAGSEMTSVIATTTKPTIAVLTIQSQYRVSVKRNVTCSVVADSQNFHRTGL